MAAHRYWRLYFTNGGHDNHFDVREIELRTAIGGADVTTPSSTVSASQQASGFEAAKAFDDSNSTTWYFSQSSFPLPAWIKVDFGAGNEKDIVEVALKAWALSEAPTEFELQWSDDNSSWTTLYKILNTSWSTTAFSVFSSSTHPAVATTASKRLWRVLATAAAGGPVLALSEIEMFISGSAVSSCTGGAPYASSEQATVTPVTNAFDGLKNSSYWSAHGQVNEWIGYLFGSPKDIVIVGITARTGSQSNESPKNFSFQYWDGAAWQTEFSMTNVTGWTSGQTRYFSSAGEVTAPIGSAAVRPRIFVCT